LRKFKKKKKHQHSRIYMLYIWLLTLTHTTLLFSYIPTYVWNIFPTELITKVKPNVNSVEVHPQLSNNGHPLDGSLWPFDGTYRRPSKLEANGLTKDSHWNEKLKNLLMICFLLFKLSLLCPSTNCLHWISGFLLHSLS